MNLQLFFWKHARKLFLFSFLFGLLTLSPLAWKQITCGFHPSKLLSSLESTNEAPLPLSSPKPWVFRYLGRGTQSFVFEDLEGEIVLKLFRKDRWKRKETSRDALLKSCLIAEKLLLKETALMYLHIHKTSSPLPQVELLLPWGRHFTVSLNEIAFAFQRKGTPLHLHFKTLYKEKDREGALRSFHSLCSLFALKKERQIFSLDPNLERNIGFIGYSAFDLDFGSYTKGPIPHEREKRWHIHWDKLIQSIAPEWVDLLQWPS